MTANASRTQKALALAAAAGQWLRLTDRETGARFYGVRSSDGRHVWRVTPHGCSCPDRGYRGVVCAHMLASRMVREAAKAIGPTMPAPRKSDGLGDIPPPGTTCARCVDWLGLADVARGGICRACRVRDGSAAYAALFSEEG